MTAPDPLWVVSGVLNLTVCALFVWRVKRGRW